MVGMRVRYKYCHLFIFHLLWADKTIVDTWIIGTGIGLPVIENQQVLGCFYSKATMVEVPNHGFALFQRFVAIIGIAKKLLFGSTFEQSLGGFSIAVIIGIKQG